MSEIFAADKYLSSLKPDNIFVVVNVVVISLSSLWGHTAYDVHNKYFIMAAVSNTLMGLTYHMLLALAAFVFID